MNNKKIVFVAMSGGVDSSVAAALLKKRGFDVVGVHMKCWSGGPSMGLRAESCSAEQDSEDARRAAEVLGIPFYVFDFEQEYKDKVVEYMVDGYKRGITPNPDVMCNKEIKFGIFLKKALAMGADYVATGHYVRLQFDKDSRSACVSCGNYGAAKCSAFCEAKNFAARRRRGRPQEATDAGAVRNAGRAALFEAKDKNKDQSYFLWTLTQDQLRHCLFPIGDYLKSEVRVMARKFGLPNADKKDSQGVCFVGKLKLEDFLGHYLPPKKGLVLNTAGVVIGKHQGAHFYTIGQRQGLKIGGFQKPLYVAEKDIKSNTILVAEGDDHPALFKKEINLRQVNFINQQPTTNNQQRVLVRVRYRQPLATALFIIRNSLFKIVFDQPQKFVASGQSAVWYGKNGEVLGGGVIAK